MNIVKKKIVYEGPFIRVSDYYFLAPDGRKGVWQVVSRTNSRKIVIIFALTREREVLLVKQYRIPIEAYVIERPAGLTDKLGETYEEAARRELREETGYAAERLIKIIEGPFNAGLCTDQAVVFFAPNAEYVGNPTPDPEENIELIKVPLDRIVDFVLTPPAGTLVDIKLLDILPILQQKGLI